MIRVEEKDEFVQVSAAVTEFTDSMGYCEYKVPLSIQGVKPAYSPALYAGSVGHIQKEQYEKEHAELVPVEPEQIQDETFDLEFLRESVYSTLSIPLELSSKNVLVSLYGKIDKIYRKGSTLVVHDDKFAGKPHIYNDRDSPYPNQILQVLTYLNSVFSTSGYDSDPFEIPHSKKMWQIQVCDRRTKEPHKLFSGYQDVDSLKYLHSRIVRFAQLSLEMKNPSHHNNSNKCNACNLKEACEFRV